MHKTNAEDRYIEKRKRKAFLTYVFCHMFWVLPVRKKKVVFTAFEGDGGYCCNPRYIAEELLKSNQNYEIVWLVNHLEKKFPNGIHKAKNNFVNRAYHLATAGTWVDNSRKAFGTAKRKNQLYIQTWHAGVALKPIGQFRGALFPKIAYLVSAYDSKLTDFVLSNSGWCTNLYPKMLIYQGEIIKTGSPRCDILINKKRAVYEDIRSQYDIPKDAKIVMFAPTFRGGSQKGNRQVLAAYPTLNFSTMVQTLEEKFGGSWYVFLRLHPQLSAQIEKVPLENSIEQMIDVSQADDMNELLCASDVLITDYSSSSFDAICAYIPVFLYLDDFEEYVQERGNLMWERSALPFSVSTSNHELLENILQFDENDYRKQIDRFQKNTGVLEDGHASARVADIIGSRIL